MSEQKDSDKLYTGSVPDETCRKVGHVPVSLVAKVPLIFGSKELTYKLCSAKKRDQYKEFIETAGGTLSGNKKLVICNDNWGGIGTLLRLSLKKRPKEPYRDVAEYRWRYFSGGTGFPDLVYSNACKSYIPNVDEGGRYQIETLYDPDNFTPISRRVLSFDNGTNIQINSIQFNSDGKLVYSIKNQYLDVTKTVNSVNDERTFFNTGYIELQHGVLVSTECIGYVVGGGFILGIPSEVTS